MFRIVFFVFISSTPILGAPCSLSPQLLEAKSSCQLGELDATTCSWLPILEDLVADRTPEVYRGIEQSFELPRHRAKGLVAPLYPLTPLLIDCPPLNVVSKVTDPEAQALLRASGEAAYLVESLFPTDATELARLERQDPQPSVFARVDRAARGLVTLFEITGLRSAMASLTRNGAYLRPGATLELEGLSGGVVSYEPLLREIDEIVRRLDREPMAILQPEIRQLSGTPGRPERSSIVWARIGSALVFRGRFEDALAHLLQAEAALAGLSTEPRWKALRQLTQLQQIQVYRMLNRHIAADLVEKRLRADGPMAIFETLLEEPGALPRRADGLLLRVADDVSRYTFQEIQPVMEAIELLSAAQLGNIDPSLEKSARALQRVHELVKTGRLDDALQELEEALERQQSFLLAAPAGLIAKAALDRGDLEKAARAIELAVRLMEQEAETQRSEDLRRSFMDTSGAQPFVAGVFLAERMGKARLAFSYAERGRAFSYRRSLGDVRRIPLPQIFSEKESRLEAKLVRLAKEGTVEKDERNALRHQFEQSRLERLVAANAHESLDAAHSFGADIARAERGARPTIPSRPPTLDEIRSLLAHDETLVAFYTGGEKLVAWRIQRGHFKATTQRWSDNDLDAWLSEIRWRRTPGHGRSPTAFRGAELLGRLSARRPTAEAHPSKKLYTRIFGDLLQAEANPAKRLILIPHGPLHRVPWAALRTSRDRYLGTDFEITTFPNAAAFAASRSSPKPPRSPR